MKPLDDITRRLFPTLAKYANKLQWLMLLAGAVIVYTLGFHNGLLLGSYRGKVADENYAEVVRRVNALEEFTQGHHAKLLRTTGGQAAIIAQGLEKGGRP